jgi:mannose/fructose-specific phosphotransferase system component IIA
MPTRRKAKVSAEEDVLAITDLSGNTPFSGIADAEMTEERQRS